MIDCLDLRVGPPAGPDLTRTPTKVPQAKAFDELFSRGGTEVNWMGLDVDELQTRNQRVKSY